VLPLLLLLQRSRFERSVMIANRFYSVSNERD